MTPILTKPQAKALRHAAKREGGNLCPVVGVFANAETMLLNALDRKGLIAWDGGQPHKGAPRINSAGRAAIAYHVEPGN